MEKTELINVVTRAQNGDSDAIGELYNAFYNSVYYFAKKTVKDDDLALDITQETFLEVIRTIGSLKAPEAFSTWLRQITYHQCTRHFRKNKEVQFDEDEEGNSILDTLADDSEDSIPEEVYEKAEFKETILKMIDTLTPEQRAVVVLYYFDELPIKKIAEIQGVSEGTIKSRLNYARKALRDGVEEYEKKTGTKLHGIPFLPLFKLFFNDSAVPDPQKAAAIGEAVSAAAGGAAVTAAAAAATTASAVTIPLGAKIAAAVVAVTVALGTGTAIVKRSNSIPSETQGIETEITDIAETDVPIPETEIASEVPDDGIQLLPSCLETHIKPTLSLDGDILTITNHTWEIDDSYHVPDSFAVYIDGNRILFQNSNGMFVDWLRVSDTYSFSLAPYTSEGTHTITVETDCISLVANGSIDHSTEIGDVSATIQYTRTAEEIVEAETEAAVDVPAVEPETEIASEVPDSGIQNIPTCLRTHIKPTLSLDGDILTITNHTWEFEESCQAADAFVIYIDGVETFISDIGELENQNGTVVSWVRVSDTVSFSLAPFTSEGTHTVTVETSCLSAVANNSVHHANEIGDVSAAIQYTRSADVITEAETVEAETEAAVDVPAVEPETEIASEVPDDGIQLLPSCLETHIKPTLSLDGDILTITNHTWEIDESYHVPDSFAVYIDGNRILFQNSNGMFVDWLRVSDTYSFSLAPYTSEGTHTITVETDCISLVANGSIDHSTEIGDVSATIQYTRAAKDVVEAEEIVVAPVEEAEAPEN